ncbi:hypothetical protein JZU46_07125 [bacterium]|nr:hypothetical protein [bacterium]
MHQADNLGSSTQITKCSKDGFPVININGQPQCIAEFINYCIGGEEVTDVVVRNGARYFVFESGHEIPLLCNCCGEPLAGIDLKEDRESMIGRVLDAMDWDWEKLSDGRRVVDYVLLFSTKEGENFDALAVNTSVLSANKMRHPAGCIHSPQPAHKEEPALEVVVQQKKKRRRK